MKSFIHYPEHSDFSIHNIPFGVAVFDKEYIACATRIGDTVVDLATLFDFGYFNDIEGLNDNVFEAYTLNEFIELGKPVTNAVRLKLQELFTEGSPLSQDDNTKNNCFFPIEHVKMLMPLHVANYTDFYSSIEHATNIGKMFREAGKNPLLPNWKHLPLGYHGRASSVVVSGTDVRRPKGQILPNGQLPPIFAPTQQMDFELELAFVVNKNTEIGDNITTQDAEDAIFGAVMLNDWSARDIQYWESLPLGPFLGKSFCTSISPWVVTLEALEPFRTNSPEQNPEVLDYLKFEGKKNFDIHFEINLTPHKGTEVNVCQTNAKGLYWNINQQLAHHTSNGCNIEVGDLLASGALSGAEPHSFASMLELSWKGEHPVKLNDGQERQFLEDYDLIVMKGWAEKDGVRVGFGELIGKILPATPF